MESNYDYGQEKPKNTGHTTQMIINNNSGPGCLVRGLWFVFVGWWVGQIWIVFAWLAMLTIIGIPVAIWMINRVPAVLTLKGTTSQTIINVTDTATFIEVNARNKTDQLNPLIRIAYFVLIGWWLSGLWIQAAYLAMITIVLIPLSFWMFEKTPVVMTLKLGD